MSIRVYPIQRMPTKGLDFQRDHRNIQLRSMGSCYYPKFEGNTVSKICRDNPYIVMEAKNDPT